MTICTDAAALPVTATDLLLALGCPLEGQTADARDLARAAIDEAQRTARPATAYAILDRNAISLPGRDITAHLGDCTRVLVTATTLGLATERALRRAAPTAALYLDAALSLLTEAAADAAEVRILTETGHTRLNFRYAPGYGDLPLAATRTVLTATDAERALGLTLTESGLMLPRKSTTGITPIA